MWYGSGMSNLLWQKKMTKTDAQRQAGNQTGDLRLTKAGFRVKGNLIDHTSYFRQEVFGECDWEIIDENSKKEVTNCVFKVDILGVYSGHTELTISHKPLGESSQGNYTTGIRWGSWLSGILSSDINCTGRMVYIHKSEDDFELIIA